jgi:hypothetical protein
MHAERDLVEVRLGAARPLTVVVGALARLELFHHLAVASGDLQRLAAGGHLDLAAVEVERRGMAIVLGALDVGLGGDQVPGRGAGDGDLASGLHGVGSRVRRREQHRLAAHAQAKLVGQILLGTLFRALPERLDPLEAEREGRGLHEPVDRPPAANLQPGAGRRTTGRESALDRTQADPAARVLAQWEGTPMPDAHTMNYIECDAPVELTLVEWRRSHTPKRSRWSSFRAAFAA